MLLNKAVSDASSRTIPATGPRRRYDAHRPNEHGAQRPCIMTPTPPAVIVSSVKTPDYYIHPLCRSPAAPCAAMLRVSSNAPAPMPAYLPNVIDSQPTLHPRTFAPRSLLHKVILCCAARIAVPYAPYAVESSDIVYTHTPHILIIRSVDIHIHPFPCTAASQVCVSDCSALVPTRAIYVCCCFSVIIDLCRQAGKGRSHDSSAML
ncbi:hypothetical protein C2E23DRAFT_577169 [Lenzites betulinus]|nr:hypothetical protein C2E23DRAFT_577169 [Lenzites betulinus]